ncbi:hypothetical protein GF336_05625 [Candidatus Woesearchaeota archaeon]|nr:hypothetical protein [Candidatus Woesearchaeota archaeon]
MSNTWNNQNHFLQQNQAKKETFYTHDSLTGQDLRIVKSIQSNQIDMFISDAGTNGRIHDHSGIDLVNKRAFNVNRGQQF